MIRKNIPSITIVVSTLFISACGGPQVAKDVASQMKKLTLNYEKAILAKTEAEQSFYQNQRQVLRNALSGTTVITNPAQEEQINAKKTVAYGQIQTSTQRDAILLANTLSSTPTLPNVSTLLIGFLESSIKENMEAYQLASQRQRQLKIDLLDGLEKVEQQSNRLKIIRLELQKLETDPSMEDRFQQYYVIGQAVSAQVNSQN